MEAKELSKESKLEVLSTCLEQLRNAKKNYRLFFICVSLRKIMQIEEKRSDNRELYETLQELIPELKKPSYIPLHQQAWWHHDDYSSRQKYLKRLITKIQKS